MTLPGGSLPELKPRVLVTILTHKVLRGFLGKGVFSIFKYFYDLLAMCAQLLSCVQFCDPMDCSLPGSSDCGILQARVLEWAVISFSRGSSPPGDRTYVSCIFCTGRQILYHCTTSMSTNYPGSSMYWSFLGERWSLQMEERGLGSGNMFHLPDALRCSTGQSVLLEGAGVVLSSTPGSAEALCEEGETPATRGTSGGGGLTPQSICAHVFQPSPCPRHLRLSPPVAGVGPPLAPVSLAEMLRAQMPLEANSSFCLSDPHGGRALPRCAPASVLHKYASCTSERVQAPLPEDPC